MNKIISIIFIISSSSYSLTALSQDMTIMMRQQMEKELIATCNDKGFLSCIGISKKLCVSSTIIAISRCEKLLPKDSAAMSDKAAFTKHGECIKNSLLKNTGVSADKLDACDSMTGDKPAAVAPPMEMKQGIAMMNQVMQKHAQSIGTDGVTLPIYKNAIVMSHFTSGQMSKMFDVEPLPALVLVSPDDTKKIVSFYRKKLKGFKEYNIDGDVLFMEHGPKKFDYSKDLETYVTTPHVLISPMRDAPGKTVVSKNKIEIAYKK